MRRWLACHVDALAEHTRGRAGAVWLAAYALLLAATTAGNLSETDDAYAFAWRVEHVIATQFDDPRLLGYHLAARALWLALQSIGWPLDGLTLLRCLSGASAVVCVALLFRLFVQRLAMPRNAALLASAALAASYGFWRYAAEADVYPLAMMLCVMVLNGLLAPPAQVAARAPLWGAAAGLAVLVYQPNAIPLLIAFVLLVGQRCSWRAALVYAGSGAGVLVLGYLAAFTMYWPEPLSASSLGHFMAQRTQEFLVAPLSLRVVIGSALRSLFALGHDIAATSWAFAFVPVQALARRLFGGNKLDDDIFLAEQAGVWAALPLLTLALLLLAAWRLLRLAHWPDRAAWREALLPALGLWLLLTALVIGRLNPGGLEAWIVMLLPLAIVLAWIVIAPVCRQHGSGAAAAFVLALALHNAAGGIALVQSARGDLAGLRCALGASQARAQDLFIVVSDVQLAECLRFRSPALALTVPPPAALILSRTLHSAEPDMVHSVGRASHSGRDVTREAVQRLAAGGRVLVFDDFFGPARLAPWLRDGEALQLDTLKQRSPVLATGPQATLRQWPPNGEPR